MSDILGTLLEVCIPKRSANAGILFLFSSPQAALAEIQEAKGEFERNLEERKKIREKKVLFPCISFSLTSPSTRHLIVENRSLVLIIGWPG